MRIFVFTLMMLGLFWGRHARADQNDPALTSLFDQLRRGTDPAATQLDIETRWLAAPEISVQILIQRLTAAIEAEDFAVASVLSEHVTGLAPSFAEGWFLKGHVEAMLENHAMARTAFERTIALEPRHYHALTALGDLAAMAQDTEGAHQLYRRALDLNPHLVEVREKADQLRFELDAREI